MDRILVVDDEELLLDTLVRLLRHAGYQVDGALTLKEGLARAAQENYDLIFLDVEMPDGNGLASIEDFKTVDSKPEVIIITGKGASDGAEQAILSGAWAYICKGGDLIKDLRLLATRALQYRAEKNKAARPIHLHRDHIIGNSPKLNQCLDLVAQAAASDASVLITGETGTGKELFAKAIHENSRRAAHNFIIVDCAALPENLIESTLFGHVKGAFTGAEQQREGLIRLADGGTLFLDEVGELPLHLQKVFLRVLQEQSFRPIGSLKEERSDFRLIAATNRNIEESIAQGLFRSDLYYRLQAFTLQIPSLAERKEDIALLTRHFINRLCKRLRLPPKIISPEFIEHLEEYDWPGNVRQLQQTLEQVFATTIQQNTLFANHLPKHFRIRHARADFVQQAAKSNIADSTRGGTLPSWKEYKKHCEKQYIKELMTHCDGKIKTACEISKLSRARLYQLREKYGLLPSGKAGANDREN